MALWHNIASLIWINIGSRKGLLPGGTNPLPEPVLIYPQMGLCVIRLRTLSRRLLKISNCKMSTAFLFADELTHGNNGIWWTWRINGPLNLVCCTFRTSVRVLATWALRLLKSEKNGPVANTKHVDCSPNVSILNFPMDLLCHIRTETSRGSARFPNRAFFIFDYDMQSSERTITRITINDIMAT